MFLQIADLDAPALRSLVLSLASSNPSLIPSIQSLLPRPTLESLLNSLSSVESPLVNSIPRGTARPEYILGRVRGPLQEWIAEVGRVCSIGESWTRTEAGKEEEHPNTVFALFLTASLSFIRVHAALPIDNVREILPALQRGWKAWLAMVQRRLGEGKLVSESTGREWLRKLEELGEGGREVRDDVERIVGPFIGLRRPVGMDMEEL
ncbi:hypothetical protein BT69DRAFT_674393 [Atractiella rhizophila]|nr:hypothetical protein BT69DRAFT_674393 [Atractiella rhizophila]